MTGVWMTVVWTLLRPLERIETLMAEVYEALVTSFAADPEAARLFGRLALDERSHASQIQYINRIARQRVKAFGDVELELAEIRRVLDDLESLQGVVGRLTLADAVTLALSVERTAAEAHARSAVAQAAGELAGLLQSLGQGDRRHVQALVDFARSRAISVPDSPAAVAERARPTRS